MTRQRSVKLQMQPNGNNSTFMYENSTSSGEEDEINMESDDERLLKMLINRKQKTGWKYWTLS